MAQFGQATFGQTQFGIETEEFYRTATTYSAGIYTSAERVLTLDRQAAAFAELFLLDAGREQMKTRESEVFANALWAEATRDPYVKGRASEVYADRVWTRSSGNLGLDRTSTTIVNTTQVENERILDLPREAAIQVAELITSAERSLTTERESDAFLAAIIASAARDPMVKDRVATPFLSPIQAITSRDQNLSPRQAESYVATITGVGTAGIQTIREAQTFARQIFTENDRKFVHTRPIGTFGDERFGNQRFGQTLEVNDGKFRVPNTYTQPANAGNTRGFAVDRLATVYSELTSVEAERTITRERISEIFVEVMLAEATRDPLGYERQTMTFSERVTARAVALAEFERLSQTVAHSIRTDADRVADLDRFPATYTEAVAADGERAITRERLSEVFLNPLLTNAERAGVIFDRVSTGYVNDLIASVERALTLESYPTTFTDSMAAANERVLTLEAQAETFSNPIETNVNRDGIIKSREADSYIDALIAEAARDGIAYDRAAGTFVEVIEANASDAIIAFTRTSNTFAEQLVAASDRGFVHLRDAGEFGTARFGEIRFGQGQTVEDGKIRGAETYVAVIEAESERELTARAEATAHLNALQADAERSVIDRRAGAVWVDRMMNRSAGMLGLERFPTTVVDPIWINATPDRNQPRATNTFTNPFAVDSLAAHARWATTFTDIVEVASERELSLEALAQVYSEMIVANASGTLTLDRAAATFLQAMFVEGEREVTRDREATVIIEDLDALADRVVDRLRDTNVWMDGIFADTVGGAPHWIIDGSQIFDLTEEIRTWDRLVLQFRAPTNILRDRIRPLLDNPGKADIIERIDGGFDAMDRSGSENILNVRPPVGREDVRSVDQYLVDDYEEEPIGTSASSWEVEVDLIPIKEKAHDNEFGTLEDPPNYNREAGDWKFEFDFGDIVTKRVSTDINKEPDGTFAGAELQLAFNDEQVRVMEESAAKLGAVDYREVPDGSDVITDESTGQRNIVELTPPADAEDTIESGTYVVEEWETLWNRGVYIVSLMITHT